MSSLPETDVACVQQWCRDRVPATARVGDLLAELDRDPTALFWG